MKQKFKKWLYCCSILVSSIAINKSYAQGVELVINGDFETLSGIPPGFSTPILGQFLPLATGWNSYGGTPDLFSAFSDPNPAPGTYQCNYVPCNFVGYQNAHSGNNYAGIITSYQANSGGSLQNVEFFGTTLNAELMSNKMYEISFWVSRADVSRYENSGLGVWLGGTPNFDPPSYNCPVSLLNNDAWTQIKFTYCGNDWEDRLIIGGTSVASGNPLSPVSTCTANNMSAGDRYIYIDDISVKEITFTVPTQTLCAKYTGTFTAVPTSSTITTSALTYTWNYGDGTTVVSTNTLNVTTHSYAATPSGIYTASLTVGNGTCSTTFTYNVVVPTVTIAITTNTNTICNGNTSFTATPNPAGTYTVSWGLQDATTYSVIPGSSYTVTNGATLTPSINFANINQNVYVYVTLTNSFGCQYKDSIYMPSCCVTPTNAVKYTNTTYTTASIPSGSAYAFGGTITVNSGGQLIITGRDVQLDPNTKFIINGTGKITITNSYVHGCNAMWDGIYANTTGLITFNNSRIEDAKRVLIDSLGSASLSITGSYLNKNNMGVVFKTTKTSTSTITIKNTLFTCSNISTAGALPKIPTAVNLTNAATLGAFTTANMLPPYNTQKSFCGIYLNTASHTGKTNSAITIGGATNEENVFDKMQMGIFSFDSKSLVQNNVFQNIKSTISPTSVTNAGIVLWGPIFGSGIGSRMDVGGSLAQKNTFRDNDYGINNSGRSALLTTYNTFSIQTTGVYVTGNYNGSTVNIRNNNIYKTGVGINFYNNTYLTASIKDNNIDNSASAIGTYADNFAIRCTEATLATNPSSYPAFDIDNNKINGYYNGIYAVNTLSLNAYDNEVHMREDNAYEHWQAGIYTTGTNTSKINNNIIDMTALNIGAWAYWQSGISLSTNQVPRVQCNSVNNLFMSLTFSGANSTVAGDGVKGNYMQNAVNGIWINNNGVIGNQAGNTGSNSSDNAWATSCNIYVHSQNNSNPNNDIFFTRSGSGYDLPSTEVTAEIGSLQMLGNNSSAAGSNTCNVNASTPSNAKMAGASSLAGLMQMGEDIAFDFTNESVSGLNSSLNTQNDMANNDVNIKAINRKQLYSNIILQQIDAQSSTKLNSFMATIKNHNTGILFAVDSLIHKAETKNTYIAQAQSLNNSIITNNNIEQSQQEFNNLYLSYLAQNKQLNANEVASLETLALQCPMFYGTAVYQARVVLFDIKKQNYISDCEKVAFPKSASTKRIANSSKEDSNTNITVYPNPANNQLFVDAIGYTTVNLKLYNIMGELVMDKSITNANSIDISSLSSGIYTYKVFSSDNELKVGKLIITH